MKCEASHNRPLWAAKTCLVRPTMTGSLCSCIELWVVFSICKFLVTLVFRCSGPYLKGDSFLSDCGSCGDVILGLMEGVISISCLVSSLSKRSNRLIPMDLHFAHVQL